MVAPAVVDKKQTDEGPSAFAGASADGEGGGAVPEESLKLVEAEEADDADEAGSAGGGAGAKKKRRRRKKKGTALPTACLPGQDNSRFRLLNNWGDVEATAQTDPPTVPIHSLYPDGKYPIGQIMEYHADGHAFRVTSEEKREAEILAEVDYDKIRRAAEAHRQVRRYAQSFVKPGMKYSEIVDRVDAKSNELIAADGLEAGRGFPCGVSVGHCAAHWQPNPGNETVMQAGDIVKMDFGIHVGGRIVDCAFTIAFDEKFDNLIKSTQEATNRGLQVAGIDARFSEIGEEIEEVIKSHEMEVDGKSIPIKAIRNLNGHSIGPYMIHGGKSVPIVKNSDSGRMEEGEVYAIETFASTGRGVVVNDEDCSHYRRDAEAGHQPLRMKGAKQLLHVIDETYGSLPFCRRWLDALGQTRHILALKSLVDAGVVTAYPPLVDVKGSFTSQMEHTVILRPTCKEIVTRGEDF